MRMMITLGAVAIMLAGFADSGESQLRTRVTFASEPDKAALTVDGRDCGVTPTTLFDLTPGRHRFKLRLRGYADRDGFVEALQGRQVDVSETLAVERGLLLLRSVPDGALIVIDGIHYGVTPRLITELDAISTHHVSLIKSGFTSSEFEVRLDGRVPTVRTERLVGDSGSLMLATEPAGAVVSVNGIERGKTPLEIADIPAGEAQVKLQLDGYLTAERVYRVVAGRRDSLNITLKPLPGKLAVSSIPEGGRVYLDDDFRGTTPLELDGLVAGQFKLRVEYEGWQGDERLVTIANGAVVREEFVLTNVLGRVEVRTSPAQATIVFDGRIVGKTAGDSEEAEFSDIFIINDVPAGEHSLLVRKDGYVELTRRVSVQPCKVSKHHRITLKKAFIPDVVVVTEVGETKGVLKKNVGEYVTLEIKPGVEREFRRADIRKLEFIQLPR